jgi:hypothetical protein
MIDYVLLLEYFIYSVLYVMLIPGISFIIYWMMPVLFVYGLL